MPVKVLIMTGILFTNNIRERCELLSSSYESDIYNIKSF